ncbi:pentatricopeptide repeat-containing protein At1g11290, chloroplastic-like [Tasmannia lanceolata]|uniref:pentatricopeptide repeat-containing protein At1g11290, chloroplastic-like n=1 Tax=Tasmannia lanceolata TaxID=3420 RepID=UPI00406442A5
MPGRNAVSWSSIISANTHCGNCFRAFDMFEEMMEEGLVPNEYTLGSLLKASSGPGDIWVGKQLHGWSIRTGFASHIGVRTSLITMYSNFKFLADALRIFCEVPPSLQEDIPTWNSIIAANVSNGNWSEGLHLFSDMLCIGLVRPTEPTYASILNACASVGAVEYGRIIHGKIVKDGLFNRETMGNSLIALYAKCGNLKDANRIILSAISDVSALKHGQEVHGQMIKSGLEQEMSLANSLITMYAKCGKTGRSSLVFERLPYKDVITWNSMLAGYAQSEEFENCFELFVEMQSSGINPDNHSFTSILVALSPYPSLSNCWKRGREIHGCVEEDCVRSSGYFNI